MILTIILVLVIGLSAFGISTLANRRVPDRPSVPKSILPYQLDRSDFNDSDVEWIFVLFTSDTCDACVSALNEVSKISLPNVVVQILIMLRKNRCTLGTKLMLFQFYFWPTERELCSGLSLVFRPQSQYLKH